MVEQSLPAPLRPLGAGSEAKVIASPRVAKGVVGARHDRRPSWIAPPQPQHPSRQIELRDSPSGVQQFETHPRQRVEDDADRQSKLRLRSDAEERAEEDLTRQHQREPSAVERWHRLAGWHEAKEQRRKARNAALMRVAL